MSTKQMRMQIFLSRYVLLYSFDGVKHFILIKCLLLYIDFGNLDIWQNLDSSIDNMKLQAIFANYGNILSCKVQVFDNGNSKGYGYVQFETPESAQKAIEELNGRDIKGKNMYVKQKSVKLLYFSKLRFSLLVTEHVLTVSIDLFYML